MTDTRRFDEVKRITDAEGAADFTGMDRQAKPRITGDVEGAGIIGNAAHALLARHVEARHQRIVAAGGIFGGSDHPVGPKWRSPVTMMRVSMPVLPLADKMPSVMPAR